MQIVRRLVHALVLVLTLVVGATAAAIIVTQTSWFKNWLRGYIVREANQYLNGRISIDRLGGNLFFGLELENVGVSMDGSEVVAVKDLGLDYNAFELISKGLSIDNIRLNKPVIYLRREGDTWSISRLIKKQEQEADRQGPARPIAIDDIGISDGSIVIDGPVGTSGVEVPKRFDRLDAKFNFKYEPVRYSIEMTHVSFRGSDPEIALNALSGGVAVRNDTVFVDKLAVRTSESSVSIDGAVEQYLTKPTFKLQISSDKLSLPEIARLVPALAGVRLQPAFELRVSGPLDRLGVELNVRSSAGQVTGSFVADVAAPGQSVAGELSVRHLDLAPILNNPAQKSDITADAKADVKAAAFSDLNSLRGTASLHAPRVVAAGFAAEKVKADARIRGRQVALNARAAAYGATVTTTGRVVVPQGKHDPLRFDLHGQARHVDLRRMPHELKAPPAATDVNADYHVAGTPADLNGDARFAPSTIAGARIAGGSTAGFGMKGKEISYRADARVADLDLQRVGEQFKVPALATERYQSSINGHATASGRGTTPRDMDVTASGTLTDTTIGGGHVLQLGFDVAMQRDTAHVKVNGSVADFDPAVVSGRTDLKGKVGGTFDVDATVANVSKGITPDSVQGRANINLQPSSVAGLEISHAVIDGDYRDSTADIRTLDIVGRDINVKANGTLALNETGQSNLKLHADSPSLDQIGKLVNRPLAGIGKLDATVTGNKRELQATGNVTGDSFKYGDNGALTASSDYTVKIPELRMVDASVDATTHATFVTLSGQNINDLTAKTAYHQKQLDFDANAKQPARSLGVAGSVLMHPEHQEIHLQRLALQTAGMTWSLAPQSKPAIQYGNNAVKVEDLMLVNGDQQISADGSFGHAGDALKLTLNNVDLASVDAILLRPPQFSGRAKASATITSTASSPATSSSVVSGFSRTPQIKADFQISQGGFRQFHYDRFSGTVDYGGKGIMLDTKLQQNPSQWMTAKGYIPATAFKTPANGAPRAHHEALAAEDRIDLHVESTPIDLGLVQGFTTALINVTGTVQAKVDVTGAADDPHPTGAITVQNAAFTVAPTGVVYAGLDGKIDLQGDRIHVDQIRVLDNQRKPLTIAGDLGVHELQVGQFNVAVKASDFKIIDNEMGNVRVNSDLRIAGELRAPRVEGDLGVTTGVVNLDPIIASTSESAYATEQTEYLGTAKNNNGQTAPPSAFDALKMDVHVTVPNDLVVRGNDLRTPGSPIGMGAMSVTLGGDIRATKNPGGQITLVGVVNTVRGTYDFQGRRFDVQRDGSVRFQGDTVADMNPALDIRTRRIIQAVEARVNIRGTLKQPEIELNSTPPLEQADILSLIVFNQPINQLGEAQQMSLVQRAQALATGAVASQLAQSIGNALNLDTFEINIAPDSGATAQLTVGQQVGQNLYVKVQQGIGDQAQTNFVLEYELAKWLRLQTNVLQGSTTQQQLFQRMQGTGVDLLFFFSY